MKNYLFTNTFFKNIFIDLFFVFLIILSFIFLTDYKYGYMIQTGDLRLHLNKDRSGDFFLNLFNDRFSNNNFTFLSISPIFEVFNLLNYDLSVVYIYFFLPILLYFTYKYTIFYFLEKNFVNSILASSLAYFICINPSTFNRIGHFTIPHSIAFFPIIYLCIYKIYTQYKYLYLIPFLFIAVFLGSSAPQTLVINFIIVLSLPILIFFQNKIGIKEFLGKYVLIGFVLAISVLHIIYPLFTGSGRTRSIFESPTGANVLQSLSRNSTLVSALSGTNYYYDELLKYPSHIGLGFLIFLLTLILILFGDKVYKNKLVSLNLLFFVIFLIIVGGYKTFPSIFEYLISNKFIFEFLWIVKDPNMYYFYLLFFMLLIFSQSLQILSKKSIIYVSIFIVIFNTLFNFQTNYKSYNEFFNFIPKIDKYDKFVKSLSNTNYRNLWLPYNTYISKNFSENIYYFPIPPFWITENKELTEHTIEYKKIINLLDDEMINKKCQNKKFISWVISTNNLNIVIDRSTINHPKIPEDTTLERQLSIVSCLESISYIKKHYSDKNIDSYISILEIDPTTYYLEGNFQGLIDFIEKKQTNVVFNENINRREFKIEKLENQYYILNESYDTNWRDSKGNPPIHKINLVNMAFENQGFYYKGAYEYNLIRNFQKTVLIFATIFAFILLIKNILRYNRVR